MTVIGLLAYGLMRNRPTRLALSHIGHDSTMPCLALTPNEAPTRNYYKFED